MKALKISLVSIFVVVGLISSFAFAAGDVTKGRVLFNDTKLGTAGKSCNSCHPDGKGLDKAADRKDLAKIINTCIENALQGKPIDPKSAEMADLITYIKSLRGK
jgi:cytochrome c553